MQWLHTHLPNEPNKSLSKCLPARNLMVNVLWDRKVVLMVEFMQQWTTVIQAQCETLKSCIKLAVQNNIMECWLSVQCSSMSICTQALLECFGWELFDHLNSTDFAPSDCHLFTYLKKWVVLQHCMESVKMWHSSQVVHFFDIHAKTYSPMYLTPSGGKVVKQLEFVRIFSIQ